MKLVSAVVLLLIANAGAQDCTTAQLITSLETLVQDSLAAGSQLSNPTLNILDQNIVCLVTDTMRGDYRLTSVVVNYMCSGGACPEQTTDPIKSQFEFSCGFGGWSAFVAGTSSGNTQTPPDANFTTSLRRDCGFCLHPARLPALQPNADSNINHCVPCHSSCVGLMECTNIFPTTCCNYIENMNCVASCTAPLEPDSNFVCVDPPFTVEIDGAALQSYSRGDSVFLNCSGSRGTVNTVQWLRDGMDLVNEDSTVLELVNVMATQGGEYTCIVNSTEGVANNTVTVHILPEFTVQPASTEVDSGSMTMLTCEAASFPAPTYTWGRVDGGAIRRNVTTNSSSLLFNQVMFGDEGGYYCNATSGGETIQSQAITLTITPQVAVSADMTYTRGDDVTLECTAMGGPNNIIQWFFRGSALTGETALILTRPNVMAADGGAYTCMASNAAGMDTAVTSVFISPYFITQPQDVGAIDGAMVTLTCEAEGFPSPSYQWSGTNAVRADVLGQTSTMLTFNPLMFGDEGDYFCTAMSTNGDPEQSETATLTISPAGGVSVTDPVINSEQTNTEMLFCSAEGGPGNVFSWTKLDNPGFSETTASISVTVSGASDGGVYRCTVTNSAGSGTDQTVINVAPYITVFTTPNTILSGGMGTLMCTAVGFPSPQVTWYHNGSLLLSSTQVAISESVARLEVTSSVQVSSANSSNSGNYSCQVQSSIAQYDVVTRSAIVLVQDTAEQPENVRAVGVGSREVILTWVEPHDNNAPITGYDVMYMAPEFVGGDRGRVVSTPVESIAITNLFPGVDYTFTVVAINEIGPSIPSDPLIIRTNDEAPASPPDNVTVMVMSPTEILITWDMVPAIDQNGIITMYEVQYEPLEIFGGQIQTQTVNVTAPMRVAVLANLQEFVNYSISVRAYTSAGEGPYSTEMTAMTQKAVSDDTSSSGVLIGVVVAVVVVAAMALTIIAVLVILFRHGKRRKFPVNLGDLQREKSQDCT